MRRYLHREMSPGEDGEEDEDAGGKVVDVHGSMFAAWGLDLDLDRYLDFVSDFVSQRARLSTTAALATEGSACWEELCLPRGLLQLGYNGGNSTRPLAPRRLRLNCLFGATGGGIEHPRYQPRRHWRQRGVPGRNSVFRVDCCGWDTAGGGHSTRPLAPQRLRFNWYRRGT